MAEDGSEALVSAVVMNVEGYGVANYVVPRGLTRGALYHEEYSDTVYAADASWTWVFRCPWAARRI